MIRWALVIVTSFSGNVEYRFSGEIYDSPAICSERIHHWHFDLGSKEYATCVEIDGNKSPGPQIKARSHGDDNG